MILGKLYTADLINDWFFADLCYQCTMSTERDKFVLRLITVNILSKGIISNKKRRRKRAYSILCPRASYSNCPNIIIIKSQFLHNDATFDAALNNSFYFLFLLLLLRWTLISSTSLWLISSLVSSLVASLVVRTVIAL